MNTIEIGERIHAARVHKKMTLQDIADYIGVARSTIQRYESGQIDNIKLPVIEAMARCLSVNPSWLLGKSDNMDMNSVYSNKNESPDVITPEAVMAAAEIQKGGPLTKEERQELLFRFKDMEATIRRIAEQNKK